MSQQALAVKLGLSIRAVCNYEGGRVPEPRSLYSLWRLARENGRDDLACLFHSEIERALGGMVTLHGSTESGEITQTELMVWAKGQYEVGTV
jgi:transcriptional regulator with XRE-family HTH domain